MASYKRRNRGHWQWYWVQQTTPANDNGSSQNCHLNSEEMTRVRRSTSPHQGRVRALSKAGATDVGALASHPSATAVNGLISETCPVASAPAEGRVPLRLRRRALTRNPLSRNAHRGAAHSLLEHRRCCTASHSLPGSWPLLEEVLKVRDATRSALKGGGRERL